MKASKHMAAALASVAAACAASAADAPPMLEAGPSALKLATRLIVLGSAATAAAGDGGSHGCGVPVASSAASRVEAARAESPEARLPLSPGGAPVGRRGRRILLALVQDELEDAGQKNAAGGRSRRGHASVLGEEQTESAIITGQTPGVSYEYAPSCTHTPPHRAALRYDFTPYA